MNDLYAHLLAAHGAQAWWPATTPFEVMDGAALPSERHMAPDEARDRRVAGGRPAPPRAPAGTEAETRAEQIRPAISQRITARRPFWIGFAMAVVLMTGAGQMVSYAFTTFYAGAEAGHISGVVSGISMVVLVGGLMLVVAHIMFSLPNRLTEAVTRYIGQGQPSLGDETEDSRIKGQVGGVAHTMTRTVAGSAVATRGQPSGLGHDPLGGRKTSRGDHMQQDVGSANRGEGGLS